MNASTVYFPALVDAVVKATILLGLAWIAGALLKNRSAALRHTVRACALSAVLLLPVLSFLLPAWRWQGLSLFSFAAEQSTTNETLVNARTSTLPTYKQGASPVSKSWLTMNLPQLLITVWLLGTISVVLRLLVGRSRFARLVSTAAPVDDPSWRSQIQEIARLMGIRRSVALLESQDTEIPLTTGALRPKVILSPDYAEWSPLRRDAILHHELAHVRRWDALAQTLCHVAIATYWFHPLAWRAVKTMRAEREQACDDYVLAAGTRPSEYAHELLEIASSLRQPEFTAALAMARRSQLEGRVMALLNPAQRRGSISQRTTLTVVLLTLCVALPLAALQTTTPQKKSSRTATAPAPTQPSNAADAEPPNLPQQPQEAKEPQAPPAAPIPPMPVTPPVGGVTGGIPEGVRGGVVGSIPPVPTMPAVPAPPQIAPAAPHGPSAPSIPAASRAPAAPKSPHAIPVPRAAPVPQASPRPEIAPLPEVAPVPPVKPSIPSPDGVVSPAAPRAAAIPALPVLRAQLAAIHAQAAIHPSEIETLRAKIAEIATTASAESAPMLAKLQAQTAAISAQTASTSEQVAALRAQITALAPITAQTTAAKTAALQAHLKALSIQQSAFSQGNSSGAGAVRCSWQ